MRAISSQRLSDAREEAETLLRVSEARNTAALAFVNKADLPNTALAQPLAGE
jgi:hypothetical protein